MGMGMSGRGFTQGCDWNHKLPERDLACARGNASSTMKSEGYGHHGDLHRFCQSQDNAISGMFLEDTVLRFLY